MYNIRNVQKVFELGNIKSSRNFALALVGIVRDNNLLQEGVQIVLDLKL